MNITWDAKWIWDGNGKLPRNSVLLFTKEFFCGSESAETIRRVHISADSRYRLLINGEWIQDGPARSFPSQQQFDTHEVADSIQEGRNTILVIVHYWGEGSFLAAQHEYGGLLFQMEANHGSWQSECVSDSSWKVKRHSGFVSSTPKIWAPLTFVEAYDAREVDGNTFDFMKSSDGWSCAMELGGVGIDPWVCMEARSTPYFSYIPQRPIRKAGPYTVSLPNLYIGFNFKPYLLPNHTTLHEAVIPGFMACSLHSPCRQRIIFHILRDSRCDDDLYLNGDPVVSGVSAWLNEGENLLLCVGKSNPNIDFDRIYPAFTDEPVSLTGLVDEASPFMIFGPFENWAAVRDKIITVCSKNDLEDWMQHAHLADPNNCYPNGSPWELNVVSKRSPDVYVDRLWQAMSRGKLQIFESQHAQQVILDFGCIQCGLLELDVTATAGVQLDFDGFEYMDNGRIQPVWGCAMRYITAEGRQQYLSSTARGFRYLRITVSSFLGNPLLFHSLKVRALCPSSGSAQTGHFECSDERLTEIWATGCDTLDLCTQDTYVDCPSWEQVCWVGDAHISSLVDYFSRGRKRVARRTIELAAQSLERTPEMESHVPSHRPEVIPVWSMLWVKMVYEHYRYTGDMDWLKEIYPAVSRMLKHYLANRLNESGLLTMHTGNLFEWSDMDWENRDCVTHNSIFLAEALRVAQAMAEIVGASSDEIMFSSERNQLVDAVNRSCWDERKHLYVDCILSDGKQSSITSRQVNVLALLYDIAPTDRALDLRDLLMEAREGMVDFASPFGLFFLLEAHAKFNLHELMVGTIREKWSRMLTAETKTFWEVFPEAKLMQEWPSRSYCHVWSAGPVYLLSRHILGISPASPGFDRIRIEPRIEQLNECYGTVSTPHGRVRLEWKRCVNHVEIRCDFPALRIAELHLPMAGARYELYDSQGGFLKEDSFLSELELTGGTEWVLRVYDGNPSSVPPYPETYDGNQGNSGGVPAIKTG